MWLALPLLVLVAWGLGRVLSALSRSVLGRLAARTVAGWDDLLVPRLERPLTLAWSLAVLRLLLPYLAFHAPAEESLLQALRAGWAVALLWGLWRTIDVSAQFLVGTAWGRGNPSARSLLAVGVRIGKVAVGVTDLLAAVATHGFPVGTALAGLGLGGLAFALAAQKTAENLIGAVTLASDQPFREGDFVRIDDLLGTVETIGLRSTRIRTLDRTLVTLPNGRVADMRIESFAGFMKVVEEAGTSFAFPTRTVHLVKGE